MKNMQNYCKCIYETQVMDLNSDIMACISAPVMLLEKDLVLDLKNFVLWIFLVQFNFCRKIINRVKGECGCGA